jgi:hypothetical protein
VADTKTPPTGTPAVPPPRPIPTLATVQTTVEVCVKHIKDMRLQVDALEKLVKGADVLRISSVPSPGSLNPPPPEPRPSMAVKAAQGAGKWGRVIMIGTGVLTVAGQLVAVWKPEYTGPFIQALRLLASLGGAEP